MTIKEVYEKYKWLDDVTVSPNSDGDNPTMDLWQAIKEEVEVQEKYDLIRKPDDPFTGVKG